MDDEAEYQLLYYDCRGIAEPIRYIFAYAGKQYKDIRLPMEYLQVNTDVGKIKHGLPQEWHEKVPYGKLPMLQVGDQKLVYSKPICRYLAAKFGLLPTDPFEDSKCDEYMDSLRDFMDLWRQAYFVPNEERKQAIVSNIMTNIAPKYLGTFNAIIEANNGVNLVTDSITWADIYLAHAMEQTACFFKIDLLKGYSAVQNLVRNVLQCPSIQDWRSKRPETPI